MIYFAIYMLAGVTIILLILACEGNTLADVGRKLKEATGEAPGYAVALALPATVALWPVFVAHALLRRL